MHNISKWAHIILKSCSICCKMFEVFVAILGHYALCIKGLDQFACRPTFYFSEEYLELSLKHNRTHSFFLSRLSVWCYHIGEFVEDSIFFHSLALHIKWSFPLRISSINVTKSAGNCVCDHIYWRSSWWKNLIFCAVWVQYKWTDCQLLLFTNANHLI